MAIFNINKTFYKLLDDSPELRAVFDGEIYIGESPENTDAENITINTLNVTHKKPQTGTSNINIHVPDVLVSIDGVEQYIANENRINEIVNAVVVVLETAVITEFGFEISTENNIENGNEHYTNLRINWVTTGDNIMLLAQYYTKEEIDELLTNYADAASFDELSAKVVQNTDDITELKGKTIALDDDVTETSANGVKSSGIYSFTKAIETSLDGKILTAQSTADTASGTASSALTAANAASETASAAASAASTAQTTAETADGKADANAQSITALQSDKLNKENPSGSGSLTLGRHPSGDASTYVARFGNGTSDDDTSNAMQCDYNGNFKVSGDVTDGSGNVLSKKIDGVSMTQDEYDALETKETDMYYFIVEE